jgi:hypothetical protein
MFENLFAIPVWKIFILLLLFVMERWVTIRMLRPKFRRCGNWRSIFAYTGQSMFMYFALSFTLPNLLQFFLIMVVYNILLILAHLVMKKFLHKDK